MNIGRKEEARMKSIMRFLKDEEGVTAIEYALIASLIALAIAGTVTTLATAISSEFTLIAGKL